MSDQLMKSIPCGDRWVKALDWYIELAEWTNHDVPVPADRIRLFENWIGDDGNRQAFDHYARLDANRGRYERYLRRGSYDACQDLLADRRPYSAQEHAFPAAAASRTRARRFQPRLIAMAATVLLVVVGALMGWWLKHSQFRHHREAIGQALNTTVGEVRRFVLDDGSTVVVGAESQVAVHYTLQRRSLTLTRGEAQFQVASDPGRPFVVTAGRSMITALGTVFTVQRDSDRVVVTVTDGSVALDQGASIPLATNSILKTPAITRELLKHGEMIAVADSGAVTAAQRADPRALNGWIVGHMEFDHEPLRYVIERVNRYSPRRIILDDFVGDQIYSGLVNPQELDAWLRALSKAYPIEMVQLRHDVCLRAYDPARRDPAFQCDD